MIRYLTLLMVAFAFGVSAQVVQLADINPGASNSNPNRYFKLKGDLYFLADDGTLGGFVSIYRVDSQDNVVKVSGSSAVSQANGSIIAYRGEIYFAGDGGGLGNELRKIDKQGNIVLVADINPGAGGSFPGEMTVFGGDLIFTADDGSIGRELYKVDRNGNLTLLADIRPGLIGSFPTDMTPLGGELFFVANDGSTGTEVWKLDGNDNVSQVADINPGAASSTFALRPLFEIAGEIFFAADDGAAGVEPWKIDKNGVASMVADINPGAGNGMQPTSGLEAFADYKGEAHFAADDGSTGLELWKVNKQGVAVQVADTEPGAGNFIPRGFVVRQGALYFSGVTAASGEELFKLKNGISQVTDINPGVGSSSPSSTKVVLGGNLYIVATDGSTGRELWVLDGQDNASQVIDLNPGAGDGVQGLEENSLGGSLHFGGNDGTTGREPYRTD